MDIMLRTSAPSVNSIANQVEDEFRDLRTQACLTVEELAEEAGLSPAAVETLETDAGSVPLGVVVRVMAVVGSGG